MKKEYVELSLSLEDYETLIDATIFAGNAAASTLPNFAIRIRKVRDRMESNKLVTEVEDHGQ